MLKTIHLIGIGNKMSTHVKCEKYLFGCGIALPNILYNTVNNNKNKKQYLHVIDKNSDGFIYFNRCNINDIQGVNYPIIGPIQGNNTCPENFQYSLLFEEQLNEFMLHRIRDTNKIIKSLKNIAINEDMSYLDLLEFKGIFHHMQEPFIHKTHYWNEWVNEKVHENLSVKDMIGFYAIRLN